MSMKVAVFFGGTSAERDVSIASGVQVVQALRKKGHDVTAVDTARGILSDSQEKLMLETGVAVLPPDIDQLALSHSQVRTLADSGEVRSSDIVFLALHGGSGENGMVQAFLDLAGIPYTGSCHQGSANAMDKDIAKRLFKLADVQTPEWIMFPTTAEKIGKDICSLVVIKPNKQGSTVGITIVKKIDEIDDAVRQAYLYDDEVMAERFIEGRELTVGVLDHKSLAVGEIIPKRGEIFDYQSKYQSGGADEIFPADITENQSNTLKELALKAHQALKLKGYSRVDFRMDKHGEFWCLEANTLPGMTPTSLLPQSAAAEGLNFADLCERICELGIKRFNKK